MTMSIASHSVWYLSEPYPSVWCTFQLSWSCLVGKKTAWSSLHTINDITCMCFVILCSLHPHMIIDDLPVCVSVCVCVCVSVCARECVCV